MENDSAAFLEAARRSMRAMRATLGAATIDPALLTCAEQQQYEGWRRREEANGVILALAKNCVPIKEIVRRTGHSRGTVRRVVHGGRTDVFRARSSALEGFRPRLDKATSGLTGRLQLKAPHCAQQVFHLLPSMNVAGLDPAFRLVLGNVEQR